MRLSLARGISKRTQLSLLLVLGITVCLVGCASDEGQGEALVSVTEIEQEPQPAWRLQDHVETYYAKSCPSGSPYIPPEDIELTAHSIEIDGQDNGTNLDHVRFVGGYDLTSTDVRFGGLSGIAALPSGELLLVSDQGDFIWLGMDAFRHLEPVSAQISAIRDDKGNPFDEKVLADAEGLAVSDGLALVSFERNHRVLAYDLTTCGANARAVDVFQLDEKRHGVASIQENGGMEALALASNGGLVAGVEDLVSGHAQLSISPPSGIADFSARLASEGNRKLTGVDVFALEDGRAEMFTVHRSYVPIIGNKIEVKRTLLTPQADAGYGMSDTQTLIQLELPGVTDNFEGVAVRRDENGQIRLFMVSDNNFSPKQRSLLLIFDVLPRG